VRLVTRVRSVARVHPGATIGSSGRAATKPLRRILVLGLPVGAILLGLVGWIVGVSRSGFWADDFLNLTHFDGSLGNLSDSRINTGKYIINAFWAAGTEVFGRGSVVPFLTLNSLVFAVGVITWLRVGSRTHWSGVEAWWIAGLFIATSTWLETALWSSNITHSGGFLALGLGLLAHERCMHAETVRRTTVWSVLTGAAWTAALVSNLLYVGLLVLAAYCAVHQVLRFRGLGVAPARVAWLVGAWQLLIPVVYFVVVAYPATITNPAYASPGSTFVARNLTFYRTRLAPSDPLIVIYAAVLLAALAGAVAAVRRRDWFPAALVGAAGVTAVPSLVQGHQQYIHYLAMPLLLLFSAVAAGARPVLVAESSRARRLRSVLVVAAAVTLVGVLVQGINASSSLVESPYGGSLATFRGEVASLTPEGTTLCVKLALDPAYRAGFVAEMSDEDGFLVPPINAARAVLVAPPKRCPGQPDLAQITVRINAKGDFVAAER